ncbi:MAG: hypothetical protein WCI71_01025 [Bacteroidota bacterium]
MKSEKVSCCALLMLFFMLFVITSCRSVVGLKYGMKPPGEESPESLISFLKKNSFPANHQFLFKDSTGYYEALRNPQFRKNFLSHMIFDREGGLLYRDTIKCQWAGADFIRSLDRDSSYMKTEGLVLSQVFSRIKPIELHSGSDDQEINPDFTMVITWAKFLGKYNYRLFDLTAAVAENKGAIIRLIYLNIDMQKSWNIPEKHKISIK